MKRAIVLVVLGIYSAALSGCSNMPREAQRTLSGGALGMAGGVALTALTGGSLIGGAIIGGAAGAAIGALTTPKQVSVGSR